MNEKTTIKLWSAWFASTNIFRKTYVANVCGHRTKRKGATFSFGERYMLGMPLAENGRPDYCLSCAGESSARCGWCGGTIYVGSYVTLYLPQTTPPMPAWTRYHRDSVDSSTLVVGCERMNCAETGGDYCGRWVPPGKVARFASAFEQLAGKLASGEKTPVVIANF